MKRKILLSLLLIPSIGIAGEEESRLRALIYAIDKIIFDFTHSQSVKDGANDGLKKIVSGFIYVPVAFIGAMAYQKWINNKDKTEKRIRIVTENNSRIKMIRYLDSEILRLEKKDDLNEEELKAKIKTRKVIDQALMNSQYNHVKPSVPTPNGTLYEQGSKVLKGLPA